MKYSRRRPSRLHRRNPGRGGGVDSVAARELELYIVNDGELYRRQTRPIVLNLARKLAKGTYDKTLAVKLWGYLAKSGAEKYAKHFGGHGERGADIFPKATRDAASAALAEYYLDEVKDAAKEIKLPKARKPRTNPAPTYASRSSKFLSSRKRLTDAFDRSTRDPKTLQRQGQKLFKLERIYEAAMKRSLYGKNPAPSYNRRLGKMGAMRERLLEAYHAATSPEARHKALKRLHKLEGIGRRLDDKYEATRPTWTGKKKPTPAEIKYLTQAKQPHFFDRKTMKFFGQSMRDFKVFRSKKSGRIFIGAPGKHGVVTLREFVRDTLKPVSDAPKSWYAIEDFVNTL